MQFLNKLITLYERDPKIKILLYLADLAEPSSIRRISRNVGMSHKNVIKHLKALENIGLVEVAYKQSNLTLYKLSEHSRLWTLQFIKCRLYNAITDEIVV
ncbi:winged helix-turn-helix domain-containing protein [Aeropyrum pernix]